MKLLTRCVIAPIMTNRWVLPTRLRANKSRSKLQRCEIHLLCGFGFHNLPSTQRSAMQATFAG
ncbi:hypothetical protein BC830DRAFT_1088258 [Chytriomyces sp. MP71]|nr:hypothetical protein BC830DRAFT_1088258 [Chytriomyces sp. MP71]